MFGIFSVRNEWRPVDEGRVGCPQRGRDVEVDLCASCGWARGFADEDEVRLVRCSADLAPLLPDPHLI